MAPLSRETPRSGRWGAVWKGDERVHVTVGLKRALPSLAGLPGAGAVGKGFGFKIQQPAALTCGHPQKHLGFKTSPKCCVAAGRAMDAGAPASANPTAGAPLQPPPCRRASTPGARERDVAGGGPGGPGPGGRGREGDSRRRHGLISPGQSIEL